MLRAPKHYFHTNNSIFPFPFLILHHSPPSLITSLYLLVLYVLPSSVLSLASDFPLPLSVYIIDL